MAPEIAAAGTLTAAAVVLVPLCFIVEAPLNSAPSAASLAALLVNAVVATALGFVVYFRLIRTIGSMGTASVGYLKPAVGVLIGCVLMGESLTWTTGAGLIAILIGVAAINQTRLPKTLSCLGRLQPIQNDESNGPVLPQDKANRNASIRDFNSRHNRRSFDHRVSGPNQDSRNYEAQSPGRLEINHKFEFRRRLHGKVRWLGTSKDATDVFRCAPKQVNGIDPVGQKAACLGKIPVGINRRNAELCCERDNELTMERGEVIWHKNEAASRSAAQVC